MIVVDVETTGNDPKKHSIVSIGAVDFNNPENCFYEECRAWDGAEIWHGDENYPLSIFDINGFTEEQIRDPNKKSPGEIISLFISWTDNCKEKTLAGHNTFFDIDFLKDSAMRYGIKWSFGVRNVDLHSLGYTHHMRKGFDIPIRKNRTDLTTDKIFNYVGLPEEPKPHNALVGAKMEAEAISRLVYGKPLLKEFEKYAVPEYLLD